MSPLLSRPSRPASLVGRGITGVGLVVVALSALGCAGSLPSTPSTPSDGKSPAASSSPSPTASSSPLALSSEEAWKVRPDGAGPVRVGMTLEEVQAATHSTVRPMGPPAEEGGCTYVSIVGAPEGLAFMVTGDRVARVDVLERSSVRTVDGVGGAGVGSTEAEVKALYPGLRVEPAKYLEGGHDLIHEASPTTKIVFETDGRKVLAFHAGREPEVSYVEGCS